MGQNRNGKRANKSIQRRLRQSPSLHPSRLARPADLGRWADENMIKSFMAYNRKWHYGPVFFGMAIVLVFGWHMFNELSIRFGNIDYSAFKNGQNRQSIADRIIAQKSLVGLRRAAVESLLGKSENIAPINGLSFYLGPERTFLSVDAEILLVNTIDGIVMDSSIISQ